jgi:O-antigen chain-terminating methyltransferase
MASNSDVDRILEKIRAEVRKIRVAGEGRGRASGLIGKLGFRRRAFISGERVRAGRILRYRDEEFVRKAYLCLLNRQPDPDGLRFWLDKLRGEGRSRVWILRMISESQEGRIHNVPVRGLKTRFALHRLAEGLKTVPVLRRSLRGALREPDADRLRSGTGRRGA